MDVYTQNEGDQIFFHSTAFPRGIHGSTALYRGFRGSLPLCKSQFLIYACHYVSAAKDNVLVRVLLTSLWCGDSRADAEIARAQHAMPRRYTPMPLILHCPGDHRKRRQACLDPATISVRTASSYTRTRDKLWDRGRGLHMTLECVRRKFARACREPRVLRRALHPSMLSVNIALILHIATDILHLRPASRRICKP